VYRYSRADLLRILRLTARQLASWEKAELVAAAESYSFFDLLQIKKVRDLCAKKVRPAVIRESLRAMQKQVAGMENPLLEASAFSTGGHRIAFRHEGRLLEPIAGQFVLDFSPDQKVLSRTPVLPLRPDPKESDVAELFARGIALEEDPRTHTEAIATYLKVIDREPSHAAAHINVGTLYYNRQDYGLAEKHYRAAIESDPRYALAYFDLGNVLDETGRVQEATGPDVCRCTLQSRAGLRKAEATTQGAAALAILREAGYRESVGDSRAQPGAAHSAKRRPQTGAPQRSRLSATSLPAGEPSLHRTPGCEPEYFAGPES